MTYKIQTTKGFFGFFRRYKVIAKDKDALEFEYADCDSYEEAEAAVKRALQYQQKPSWDALENMTKSWERQRGIR